MQHMSGPVARRVMFDGTCDRLCAGVGTRASAGMKQRVLCYRSRYFRLANCETCFKFTVKHRRMRVRINYGAFGVLACRESGENMRNRILCCRKRLINQATRCPRKPIRHILELYNGRTYGVCVCVFVVHVCRSCVLIIGHMRLPRHCP